METTERRRLYAGRPWQVVAAELIGPMWLSARENTWILVLTDHFTLAIPDASAPQWPGPRLVCVLPFRATGTDTYESGCPISVPTYKRPLLDMGGGASESDHPISPAKEQSHRAEQQNVRQRPQEPTLRLESGGMGHDAATNHASLPQHTTLHHAGDP